MIEVGTEVIGNWGAMHPISEGVVVAVTESGYTVEWAEGDEYSGAETITCSYPFGKIKREGETSINGSPIGVFVKEDVEVTDDDIKKEIDMTNNEMKQYTLGNMAGMLEQLRQKVNVLDALDRDTTTTGSYDLHDQLTSMFQALDKFDTAVMNGVKVVPSK